MSERWYRDGEPIWREPDNVPSTLWVTIASAEPPEAIPEAPGPPDVIPVDNVTAPPEPEPLVSRAQRIRNLVAAVRSGDKRAVDLLREAMGHD